jgi:HemY protein
MRRILLIVIAVAVTIWVAWHVSDLPGTVTASLSGYTVQVATSLALVAVVVVVLVLYAILRLLAWIFGIPLRVGFWRARHRRASGDAAVTRTLVAIAAGAEGDARREAARARTLLGDTPQTLLLAAEAGRLAKRDAEATTLYKTLAGRQDAALLGLRGLFRQAITAENWDEAAAIARRAEDLHPGGSWLREERAQLAVRVGNWPQAMRLAGPEAPHAAFVTAAADAESDPNEALRLARQAWKDNPGFAPAALAYARRLRATGRDVKALQLIREAWTINPQPELAACSVDSIADMDAKLREATRIVGGNPEHPESRLLMARLLLEAGRIGEARRELDAARQAGLNQTRLWLLLADVEVAEHGDTPASRDAQRDLLRRASQAESDPAWRCESCGTEYAAWQPACPVCHTAGRINWVAPKLVLTAS